jgi:hypothetical protein
MVDPVERLVSRLDKVTGRNGRYTARCPAHDDRGPSLSVSEGDDGRCLVHCFAGCDVHQVVSAVGLELSDLFPPDAVIDRLKVNRTPAKNYRAVVNRARPAATLVAVYAAEIDKHWDQLAPVLELDGRDRAIFKGCLEDLREVLNG